MTSSNQRYLIYLEPYRMYFYGVQWEQVVPIDLPTNVVRDQEVLSRDQLYALVDTLLATNGIKGGSAIMVLSPALLFEKQIVQDLSDEARRNAVIKEYIDNVPFERTAYISYPIQTGIGVMATNEELFVTIKKAFERKSVSINLIVPLQAYSEVQIPPQTGPDPQTAVYLLQNADQVKQFAFHVSLPVEAEGASTSVKKKNTDTKTSKKLPIYLSVFGFLIFVLLIVIVMANQPPATKPTTTTVNAEAPAAVIQTSPPVEEPESSGSAEFDRAALRMQITTPALFRSRIDEIKTRLSAAGYTTIDVVDGPAAESTVLYLDKSKLSAAQRNAATAEMRTYINEFSVQEVDGAEYAVRLVVGGEL